MKLTSKDLERRLRSAARHEMRQDKAVWKDYRRHRPSWIKRILGGDYRQVLPYLYFGFVLVMAAVNSGREILVVLGVAIYASATTVFRGLMLRSGALQGYDRAVLVHLPISDEAFLRHEVKQSILSWSRAAIVFFLAYGAALVSAGHVKDQIVFAAIAAILQSACGLCLAMLLIAFAPRVLRAGVSTPLYLLIFVCLWLPASAVQMLWPAVLLTPGGWVSHGFAGLTGLANGNPLCLVPAFIMAACLPAAYGALQKQLLNELNAQTLDELVKVSTFETSGEDEPQQPGQLQPLSPDSDVWKGHFLESASWDRAGWMERFAVKFFSQRQKVVAEFMLGDQLGAWSKRWRTSAIITLVGLALTMTLRGGPTWVFFLPLIGAAMWGAPLFGGFWWGFFGAPTSGYLTPAYAGFPLGYTEISKVMWKANAIRVFVWTPLALIYVTALAMKLGQSWEVGVTLSVEIILLVLAVQPAMIAGHFSVGSNDTKQLNWQAFLFFMLALVLFVILIVAAILLFEADAMLGKLIGTVVMFGSPATAWWGYSLLFNRGRTDLLSKPE
jgi:hypothetical protein